MGREYQGKRQGISTLLKQKGDQEC